MNCKHKSLENIHCFKCDKTHHEIVKELEVELNEWKSVFGSQQLSHALEKYEQLQAEIELLKAELRKRDAYLECHKNLCRCSV